MCVREKTVTPASLHTTPHAGLSHFWFEGIGEKTPHYHFNTPDYYSTHRLSSSFENLITVVQDKNSLARLSQGACYPDDTEAWAHCLHLSFNPDSQTQSGRNTQHADTHTHTHSAHHFIRVTNPEIDGSRNTDTELDSLFDGEQSGWCENKKRKYGCRFMCDTQRQMEERKVIVLVWN